VTGRREAQIIDLARWRREHPPLLRCWAAYWRCIGAWSDVMTACACSAIPGAARNKAACKPADSAQ